MCPPELTDGGPITEARSQQPTEPGDAAVGLSRTKKVLLVSILVLMPLSVLPLMIFFPDPDVAMISIAVLFAGYSLAHILLRRIALALIMALLALSFLLGILFQDPLPGEICFTAGMAILLVNMVVLLYGLIRERKILLSLLFVLMLLGILVVLAAKLSDMFS
ncbi:MAG TPA: hypothetical protein VMY35_07830 [Phycisphaerae bacterium]|nr:hypothetical protein [Phycisphaerae bacterium]